MFFAHVKLYAIAICISCLLVACISGSKSILSINPPIDNIPEHFPSISYPSDNAYDKIRWLLGKKLFYDKTFSADSSISCASCHKAELAFSDSVALSPGAEKSPGTRNAPSLANVAYHPYYTRDGGVTSLEMQVLVPIQEHNEFNSNILEIANRLKNNPEYVKLSRKAYDRELDYYVITRALANFERTLISGNSRYDRYLQGQTNILSAGEQRGMNLFFSDRTNCSKCHNGFNFTNYSFENNGLYEVYNDIGRKRLTLDDKDLELFKVPSLRNIALTKPYMHDGSLKTLEAVINHYDRGGVPNKHKSQIITQLGLNQKEKEDLVSFLKTLTDSKFINNPQFR